jgi:hypothetical protein
MVPSPTPGPGPGGAVPPDLPLPLLEPHPHPHPIPLPRIPLPNEPDKATKDFLIETEPKTTSILTSSTPISTFLSRVKKINVVFAGKRKAKDASAPAKRARIDLDLNTYHSYEVGETAGGEETQEEIQEEIEEEAEEEIQEETETEKAPATATMEKPSKRRVGRPRTTTIQSTATSSDESTSARSRRSLSRSKGKSKSENSSGPSNPILLLTIHKEADALRGYPTPSGDINNFPSQYLPLPLPLPLAFMFS